jgi:hypothetical protein
MSETTATESGALLAAIGGLLPYAPGERATAALRRALAEIVTADHPLPVLTKTQATGDSAPHAKTPAAETTGAVRGEFGIQALESRPSTDDRGQPKPKSSKRSRAVRRTIPLDPVWGPLRQRVRAEMATHRIDLAQLAAETLIAAATLSPVLSRNSMPSGPIFRRLGEWAANRDATREAPVVAAAATFRPANGAAAA